MLTVMHLCSSPQISAQTAFKPPREGFGVDEDEGKVGATVHLSALAL